MTSPASADPELHLRLLVEDAIAGGASDFRAVADSLRRVAMSGRAYRAVGALTSTDVAALVAEAELALFVRGATWLDVVLSDLPSVAAVTAMADAARAGALVSVVAAGDTLVEVWSEALKVRPAGSEPWGLAGAVPEGHHRLEVRTSSGLAVFDLEAAKPVTDVAVVTRPATLVDVLVVWASLLAPAALVDVDPIRTWRHGSADVFEPLAVRAGDIVVTAIERGEVLHAQLPDEPAVAWIVSPDGIHVVADGVIIDPPVPPPPARLTLVLVDGGTVTEIALRP